MVHTLTQGFIWTPFSVLSLSSFKLYPSDTSNDNFGDVVVAIHLVYETQTKEWTVDLSDYGWFILNIKICCSNLPLSVIILSSHTPTLVLFTFHEKYPVAIISRNLGCLFWKSWQAFDGTNILVICEVKILDSSQTELTKTQTNWMTWEFSRKYRWWHSENDFLLKINPNTKCCL